MNTPCNCGRMEARGVLTDIYITTGNLTWKEESEGAKVNECNIRCQIRTRKGKERREKWREKAVLNAALLTAAFLVVE